MKITVWNEFAHEKTDAAVKAIYPDGIHETIAAFLRKNGRTRAAPMPSPRCRA